MLLNQHGACEHACVRKKVEKFQLFGASDAGRVNSQRLYTLAKELRVFYQCCDCYIKKQTFEFSSTSIYQTSIICTPFSLNQNTTMLAAGTHLLAHKHHGYAVYRIVTNGRL